MSNAAAYERSYERTVRLLTEDAADVAVPTCPGWTVKDVIAHLAGFFSVYRSGGPQGFGAGWGDREVERRRDLSLADCVREWTVYVREEHQRSGPEDLFGTGLGAVALADVLAHEQDIRTALNKPGARNDPSIPGAVQMGLSFIEQRTADVALPTLRVETSDLDRTLGSGDPQVTLRTSTFELFRTLHGRRTVAQVRALEWDGDPGRWLDAIFLFGPAEESVESSSEDGARS